MSDEYFDRMITVIVIRVVKWPSCYQSPILPQWPLQDSVHAWNSLPRQGYDRHNVCKTAFKIRQKTLTDSVASFQQNFGEGSTRPATVPIHL